MGQEEKRKSIKLTFYILQGDKEKTHAAIVEREATPNTFGPEDRILTYKFDMIEGYGRPFSTISAGVIGKVVKDMYHTLLVVTEDEKEYADAYWEEYYIKKTIELENKLERVKIERKAMKKNTFGGGVEHKGFKFFRHNKEDKHEDKS